MENNIDRDSMIRVDVPGTSGFYRLRCEAFFTVSKADFKKMMKALQADTETAADNARIISEWAFQNREAVKAAGSMERWAAINSIFSDYQEKPESAIISAAVSDLEKLNKKLKTGRKVTKEIRGDDLYFTNNSIVLKHGNAAMYEDYETCVETSNTYERIFSGFENKAFIFSQVLPDAKTLKIQGKTRGAKQTAYYVTAKGSAFNVNYIQYAAAVTDSRDIYFTSDGMVCYMAGNGFTVAIAQCAIDFSDCANNIIITESRNTLAGMEVIYKYPCGDSLPVYRCIMEYFNGDHNTTYHPTREAALQYAAETEKHYPGIIAGISINSGTIAGHMSWNEDGETIQAANIEAEAETEAAEAKENNISSVPAGKEFSDHETDADIVFNASDASDAFQDEKTEVTAAADPEKLEPMPETAPAVIPTKTAENRTEGNDSISVKASGKTSVYQPKTGITEGIKKETYSRQAENAIPAGIEKMSNCTKSTIYTIITNYHNMPTLPTMYRNDNMHNLHELHNTMASGFPSALSALEKIPFCDGKNAFCDIPSGVPPGPP